MTAPDDAALAAARRLGYEPRDAPPGGVVLAAVALIAGIGAALAIVATLLALFKLDHPAPPPTATMAERTGLPGPRLETAPGRDRAAAEAAARAKLQGYARDGGRIHIPIERAMDIVAAEGWRDPPGEDRR
jgi:hypothetical protein